jgi:coproporphyrinogen III oxidase-like Fe-S oxidoreductase
VNIDLMTGLQGQSPRSWEITLRRLEQLARSGAIDSVFIYPYHDDPRSKTYGQPNAVPGFVETAHSDALARDLFTRMGWRELGARFYRSPRHVRRELLGLARMRINPAYGQSLYHGLGCSSFSLGDRATYLNHRKPAAYCDAVEEGQLAISHWTTLSPAQQATRDLSFDLLYSPITRVRTRRRKYGQAALRFHDALLDHWVDLGLGERDWLLGTFKLNALGKLVHQQIIPQHYLEQDRDLFDQVMVRRQASGRRYRGY